MNVNCGFMKKVVRFWVEYWFEALVSALLPFGIFC